MSTVAVFDDEGDMEHGQRGFFLCDWLEPILGPGFLPVEEDYGGRTMDIPRLRADVRGV